MFPSLARLLWRLFGLEFSTPKSIEVSRPRARTVPVVDFVTNPARRRRSRACDAYDWSTLHLLLDGFLLDRGNFVRLALLPLRRAFGFDRRNQGIAASHAFLRCDIGGVRAVGDRTLRGISLNTYQIFLA